MKPKIFFCQRRGNLNEDILLQELDIVSDFKLADYFIAWCTVPIEIMESEELMKKTILIQSEGPLTSHRRWTYKNFDKFHTVICFNPVLPNSFKFGTDILAYPYRSMKEYDRKRKDTIITKRGVFFAGMKSKGYEDDIFMGSVNLKKTRDRICQYLLDNYPCTTIHGRGWNGQEKNAEMWRKDKQDEIEESGADFVLCMENQIYTNYLTEKIHDGFSSDRVVLYLGEPNAINLLPKGSFVSLNHLFNPETFEFNYEGLINIMKNMTQKEYDSIIQKAREWRESISDDKYWEERDNLTKLIMRRIKNE